MNHLAAASLTAAVLVGGLATPADGQSYRGAAGWGVGALYSTSLNDGANADLDLEPEIAPMLSLHVDHWWGSGRTGVRFQLGTSQPELDWIQGPRDIAVYTADVNLMVRLLEPSPENRVIPHLSVGGGGIWWLLGDGPTTTFGDAGVVYDGEEGVEPTGVASFGLDFLMPWEWDENPILLRFEARDVIQFDSPFDPTGADDDDFGVVHNVGITLGLHTGIGLLGPATR